MGASLALASKQIIIYGGIPVCITGIIGNALNLIVFLSLETFRKNACAFYLIMMSMFNIGQLCFGFFFSRVIIALIGTDGTTSSLFYCKFRISLSQFCVAASLTCFCLATVDQFFATCSQPRWQRFSNIKVAHRLVIITILLWICHGIPYIVFYHHIESSTNTTSCGSDNLMFNNYRAYFFVLGLIGYLPVLVAASFGYLSYRKIQQIAYRTVPIVRRELDKQLTSMVLIQVIFNVFTILPYTTANALSTDASFTNDPNIQRQFQLILNIIIIIYYIYFASPFYIYMCASERFRRQFLYVLSSLYCFNQCKQPTMVHNQITPEVQTTPKQ
ncbi:unnamed protein product [Adineta ricciae]|uniref:G-protein coupled receptors family 1 profile domain-containing protein n=1 Tax=Adineta ricciae TaxID=249248 RepID=A0A813TRY1_ADIRI|nr:unnamed protein product [Adineta ricciae]CAF1148501.1 unnamed protein product [Adineta ricciae]